MITTFIIKLLFPGQQSYQKINLFGIIAASYRVILLVEEIIAELKESEQRW